ncbi:T9SS type A sorting domain-containing protein [Flavivirga eckloniae]|uniref:Secretion system C-terminal sorting domain-containing protein n=1 Tax=Flavivirga eckloniae TaxID=1803846 RepID=A0A2K9PU87_9FLAO|nr:T9SS type A sorting domain-containing protein [Flavivirga eckloniae]AUP80622.1 hypothetical protein C1H87_18650 [Flavivirga eckloniae]
MKKPTLTPLLFTFFAFIFLISNVNARTYHVNKNASHANNNGPGTLSEPKRDFQHDWFQRNLNPEDNASTIAGTIDINPYEYGGVLSTPKLTKNDFKAIPNPTSGALFIESSETFSEFKIYNQLGQISKKIQARTKDKGYLINISDLNSGIYILQASNDNIKRAIKVIKI